jgi:exosome complex protein LRP1
MDVVVVMEDKEVDVDKVVEEVVVVEVEEEVLRVEVVVEDEDEISFFFLLFYGRFLLKKVIVLIGYFDFRYRVTTKSNRPDEEVEADFNARATQLESSLNELETFLSRLDSVSYATLHENLTPIDQARFDLTATYTLNSLMWAYLRTRGMDPKQTQLKSELDRVKSYMDKLKAVVDRQSAPRVDKQASTRLMRNALWQQAQTKNKTTNKDDQQTD